jgi:hypothetical protein
MVDKIYDLMEEMEDELEGAEDYAKKAIECAKTHPSDKQMYVMMAEDELKHFDKLAGILKSHTDMDEGLKHYVNRKHVDMLKEYAEIKHIIARAND